jgi:prolycopene isomerase
MGGLTAGALLAKDGLKTLVIESHSIPGGYVTSFKRKDFWFDSVLDAISGCHEGGWVWQALNRLGLEKEIEFIRLDPIRTDAFPDFKFAVKADLNLFVSDLQRLSPKDAKGISELFEVMKEIYHAVMTLPADVVWKDPRIAKKYPLFYKYKDKTFKRLLNEYVQDEKARAILCDRSAFMGLPPSQVSAIGMATMIITYDMNGGYRVKGLTQKLPDALAKSIKKNGGSLLFNSTVNKVIVKDKKAVGIAVEDGRIFYAKKIISNISAKKTFLKLVGRGHLQSEFADKIEGMRPSVSFFIVYLGIDMDLKKLGLTHSIGSYPSFDIEGTFSDINRDICSPKASLELIIYTLTNPDMAPKGGHSLILMTKAGYDYEKDWKGCKEKEAEGLIKMAERVIPNLSRHIIVQDSATPLTLERYTGNDKGAAFGWAQGVDQVGLSRPQIETPIENLYLTGHWTIPGGGVESVVASGILTARKILKESAY